MSAALELFAREVRLAWGRGGGPLVSVGFYAGVATLLPLATGPEPVSYTHLTLPTNREV